MSVRLVQYTGPDVVMGRIGDKGEGEEVRHGRKVRHESRKFTSSIPRLREQDKSS